MDAQEAYVQLAYSRGWWSAARGASLASAVERDEPDAWFDGYRDRIAGREHGHLLHRREEDRGYNDALDAKPHPADASVDYMRGWHAGSRDSLRQFGWTTLPPGVTRR